MDHMDRLNRQLDRALQANDTEIAKSVQQEIDRRKKEYAGKKLMKTMVKPCYFNTGCCCFPDGDLTGIEIEGGFIRLVKWKHDDKGSKKFVLEESPLFYPFDLV